jgi:hypothetical protein
MFASALQEAVQLPWHFASHVALGGVPVHLPSHVALHDAWHFAAQSACDVVPSELPVQCAEQLPSQSAPHCP